MIFKFTLILLVFNSIVLLAQPRLTLSPDNIEFEDVFHRNKNVLFINTGDAALRIDSLVYRNYYYYLRFNKSWDYPVLLQPNDTIKMDCILESFAFVPASDTSDTLFIYSNGTKPLEKLKLKIKYYDDDYSVSYLKGQITDSGTPVDSARVYFFYNNNYIIKSVFANHNGFYNTNLPPGLYAVAVEKDSYYVSFYDNQFDPFNADLISLQKDSTKTINLQIDKMSFTGKSISGIITDSISLATVKKVQAFSDYYIPSFYNYANKPAVFWQQADSIYINGSLSNVNILMPRDSSVGGGRINGTVTVNSQLVNLSDVMVLAKSTDYNLWYNYGFLKDSSQFRIADLPYGNYKLFAQKIGFNDGVSTDLQISPSNTIIDGVNIPIFVSSIGGENLLPNEIQLYQNYPNPFNPSTKIRFTIPSVGTSLMKFLQLKIYDILGNEVATLVNEQKEPGYYEIEFEGTNLSSGVYLLSLNLNNTIITRKMMLVK